jgi:hypothetical protein
LATARRTQVGAHEAVHRPKVSATHFENLAPRAVTPSFASSLPIRSSCGPPEGRHGRTTRSDMDTWTNGSSDIGVQS